MPVKRRSDDPFARLRAATAHLPAIEEGTSYGTPALKVRGRLLARLKDADTLVVACGLDEKELLLEADPKVYFETDHYRGWPWVLVRLRQVAAGDLRHRLEQAWRLRAPRRLVAGHDREAAPRGLPPKA